MHLSSPQSLWLALTIPAILALYILRPRQMQKIVPSALLWRQITVPQQAARPWQRLRPQLCSGCNCWPPPCFPWEPPPPSGI